MERLQSVSWAVGLVTGRKLDYTLTHAVPVPDLSAQSYQ